MTAAGTFQPLPATTRHHWYGPTPSHWGTAPLKRSIRILGGGTPSKDDESYWLGDIPWASPKDIKVSVVLDTEDHISARALFESATQLVPAQSVLVVFRSGILRHTLPSALAGRELALNQDLKAFVCSERLSPRFLRYLLAGLGERLLTLWRKQGATVESLDLPLVVRTSFPEPPVSEQNAIADYLDRETARLDALMDKNQRLLILVRSRWQAELDLAFRPVREVVRARRVILHVEQGWSPQAGNRVPEGSEWGVLKVGCVNGMRFRPDEAKVLEDGPEDRTHLAVRDGDVLMSRANTRELVGSACLVTGVRPRTLLCDKLYRITLLDSIDPRYFVYAASSPRARGAIELSATGASDSMLNIAQSTIKDLELPLPPLADQLAIVSRLDHLAVSMEAAHQLVARQNALLQERRQALITAAVTGQLDLPEAA